MNADGGSGASSALSITATNGVARALHLALLLLIANRFGSTSATDDVFLLYACLLVVVAMGVGAVDATAMPGSHRAEAGGFDQAFRLRLLRHAVLLSLACSSVVVAVFVLFSKPLSFTASLVLLPVPVLTTYSAVLIGLLNADKSFRCAVVGPVHGALWGALVLLFVPNSAVGLAVTLLTFGAGRALGLTWHSRRWLFQGGAAVADQRGLADLMRWTFRGARLQVLGALLLALNPVTDAFFARSLGSGAVTYVEYISRLWNMVPMLFTGALALFFSASSQAASRDVIDLSRTHRAARTLGFWALLASLLVALLAKPIVEFCYGWGNVDVEGRATLSWLLAAYVLGAAPYVMSLTYVRAICSVGAIVLLTRWAALSVLLNVVLDAVLIGFMGLPGVGLATSLVHGLSVLALGIGFHRWCAGHPSTLGAAGAERSRDEAEDK